MLSNGLSHNSPAKGWPYRCLSRWTTGSSMLDHDLGHLYVVDESICLDIPILESKIVWEHPPFPPGYMQMLRQLLVLRNQEVWIWYPWRLLLSCVMLMTLVQWILHKALNRPMRLSELFRPSSLLHRSPLSYFWLSSSSTPKFSAIFPFFIHCCFCCGYLHGLRHRNKFVNQIVML